MARLALDDAAWNSRWRTRSTAEKSLLSLGLLLVAVTATGPLVSLVVLAVSAVIALGWARVPVRGYAVALLAPAFFVLPGTLVVAIHLGPAASNAAWSSGPFWATRESLLLAGTVAMRSVAAFSALLLLAATTPMTDVLSGLRRVRAPEVLVDIAGLIYRMLFSLLDAVSAIMEAQRARLGYSSGRAARRSMGRLGGAVMLQAWRRAQRLEAGLAGRGYTGSLLTLRESRPVSTPFVLTSVGIVGVLAAVSLSGALR